MAAFARTVCLIVLLSVVCNVQSVGVATTLYDSLQPLGCTQFLAILNKCGENVRRLYRSDVRWTLFVFNDTAFASLPPSRRSQLLGMTAQESEYYIKSFTLGKDLLTTQFRKNQPEQSQSARNTMIFFMDRALREGNAASGIPGPTEYYANGGRVIRPNIPAGRSLIHVIDRVLEEPSSMSILGYISIDGQPDTSFFHNILSFVSGNYYDGTVEVLNSQPQLTALIPTKEALAKIPSDKLTLLQGNVDKLDDVIRMHIMPRRAMYTSFVYHNEGVDSLGRGQVIFRSSIAREAVFVSSGGVTAQIVHGNITCRNGAIQMIDTLLGYVYNSAKDEIELSPLTRTYEELLLKSRNEIQQDIVKPSGVTLFVPINEAFTYLPSFYNLNNNQSLINKVIQLGMLELGQDRELTSVNGDYAARLTLTSAYFRWKVQVYSQGNETWIESGYVKARVVRPDIRVTNGYVHLIDAVPGAPSRDVPNTIFCEDWLLKSSVQLSVTGLNDFMRDKRIRAVAPCTTGGGVRSNSDVFNSVFSSPGSQRAPLEACAGNCQFTIFVPNGTAIDHFENMPAGQQIQENVQRWQYVLARHITRQVIYLDQIAVGAERTYTALNGNAVRFRRVTDRHTYVYFMGVEATVLHSDLGATNGVVHIINKVIYITSDLTRTDFELSSKSSQSLPCLILYLLCSLLSLMLLLH